MGNVMSYSGIVTKIRAMQARLLTEKDFDYIAGLQSVPEAIEYLKGKPAYASYMNQMDLSLYHSCLLYTSYSFAYKLPPYGVAVFEF